MNVFSTMAILAHALTSSSKAKGCGYVPILIHAGCSTCHKALKGTTGATRYMWHLIKPGSFWKATVSSLV